MSESCINIKSSNKAAFLLCSGAESIGSGIDESDGMAYLIFPYDTGVQDILNRYYKPQTSNDLAIFNFIRQYWLVRDLMKNA